VAQRCRLPLRQVKTGLAALIQLRLVYHHTTPDGQSTYQANTDNAYNLMRTGKLVALVERSMGSAAATVMEHLAVLGYATADELEANVCGDSKFDPAEADAGPPQTNGHTTTDTRKDSDRRNRFRAALADLVDEKYIVAVRDAHFQSVFDARQDVMRHFRLLDQMPASKGKKSQLEVEEKVDREVEQRLDGSISAGLVLRDLEARAPDALMSAVHQVPTLLCIDYTNVVLSIRNERIAAATEKLFGKHTARVAQAACLQVDIDSGPFRGRTPDHPDTLNQRIDVSLIGASLSAMAVPNGVNGEAPEHDWPTRVHATNGHGHSNGGYRRDDPVVVRQLAVLAEGPFPFLSRDYNDAWTVNRVRLNHFLRDKELMGLMGKSVDGPALRIVRMLVDKGKLDEKSLQELGLMGAKELRQCLAQLQVMGFLELQEVPREPQRQPNRTIFLWFYDPERVRKVILGRLYKAMARLYQRLHLERDRLSSTLSKVERTDVQGSEQEMLAPAELDVLFRWRQKETWFMAELDRMDDSVAVLRDI
jgi:DNA-directed RNA polymerase III subunit RPC3